MIVILTIAAVVAQASLVSPTTDRAWQEVRAAVTDLCPGADDERQAAAHSSEVGDYAAYVHHVIRCGEQQKDKDQALLFTDSQIEGSILYSKPDADEAASWRRRAEGLIAKALLQAKLDQSLTALLKQLQDRLP
jgi:hypothetical protein